MIHLQENLVGFQRTESNETRSKGDIGETGYKSLFTKLDTNERGPLNYIAG